MLPERVARYIADIVRVDAAEATQAVAVLEPPNTVCSRRQPVEAPDTSAFTEHLESTKSAVLW